MIDASPAPDTVSFNAAISACEKGGQWDLALELLGSALLASWVSPCPNPGTPQLALVKINQGDT